MINNKINLPPIVEVQELQEKRVQLPSVEEIKKYGLSDELKEQLLNPSSKFSNDVIVYTLTNEDRETAKNVGYAGAVGLGLLTIFCPPAGIIVASACGTTALAAQAVSKFSTNENVRDGATTISEVYGIAATGGVVSGVSGKCKGHSHK